MTATWAIYRAEGVPLLGLSGHGQAAPASWLRAQAVSGAVSRIISTASENAPVALGTGAWLAKMCCEGCVQSVLESLRNGVQVTDLGQEETVYFPVRGVFLPDTFPEEERLALLTVASEVPGNSEGRARDAADVVKQAQQALLRENAVTRSLRKACQDDSVFFEYQPIMDLRSGKVAGAEALMRIRDCGFGPGDFIPAAERSGLISLLGARGLSAVARQWMVWQREGVTLSLAVNVSPIQLRDGQLLAELSAITAGLGELADCFKESLELEITESVELTASDFAVLNEMHRLGFRFAMDDFGAGAASIRQLLRCPPGRVKLDREVVALLTDGDSRVEQFKTLVQLARSHGSSVVVEGIETGAQLESAIAAGADYGQGFYFSKALPADTVTAWMRLHS